MLLPWFFEQFPLYLAPMAGVSDKIFRQLCKEYGADVLTTEFVSAEGIFRRNARTREYLDFDEIERPIGGQLFGADGKHMTEAACHVGDWVRPDIIELNFGCPVKKVVSRNGGSALVKDCATLASVATAVVRSVARPCAPHGSSIRSKNISPAGRWWIHPAYRKSGTWFCAIASSRFENGARRNPQFDRCARA